MAVSGMKGAGVTRENPRCPQRGAVGRRHILFDIEAGWKTAFIWALGRRQTNQLTRKNRCFSRGRRLGPRPEPDRDPRRPGSTHPLAAQHPAAPRGAARLVAAPSPQGEGGPSPRQAPVLWPHLAPRGGSVPVRVDPDALIGEPAHHYYPSATGRP